MQEVVQPRILEQVVACKDDIAQQYLMQCLIQGFPDDFHLASLEPLLGTLPQLQLGVKVHVVLSSLLDRLSKYVPPIPYEFGLPFTYTHVHWSAGVLISYSGLFASVFRMGRDGRGWEGGGGPKRGTLVSKLQLRR